MGTAPPAHAAAVCADRACALVSYTALLTSLGGAVWVADPSPCRPAVLAAVVGGLGVVAATLAIDARMPCAGERL